MLTLNISAGSASCVKTVFGTENEVWKAIGSVLPLVVIDELPNGNITVSIKETGETVCLNVKKRGTFIKNGVTFPSMYVTVTGRLRDMISESDYTDYKECYLTCINSESNNYKFYHMIPGIKGVDVSYGRIGAQKGEMFGERSISTPYPLYLYWIRYYEKLSKGYIDQSEIYLNSPVTMPKKKTVKNIKKDTKPVREASVKLYNDLYAYAKNLVRKTLVNHNITKKQVEKSRYYFQQMGQRKTVRGFNNQLLNLMSVCPRKVRDVSTLLAVKPEDFKSIVEREEQLINAMTVLTGDNSDFDYSSDDVFASEKIDVFPATEKQIEEVKSHLSDSLKSQIKNVYRVIDHKKKASFEKYLKDNKIKKVKCFWHGSRNENWLSIVLNGLQLNPNAAITGKMFGQGIYFAPSSQKSWGYTSYYGSRWANGRQGTAFMGLYATAYGKPYDVTTAGRYTQGFLNQNHCNCVHAHAGSQLYNDEVVFYDENAMLLNYIVEFN